MHSYEIRNIKVLNILSLLGWTLVLAPLLKPNGVSGISKSISRIYDVLIILSFIIILLFHFNRSRINQYIILVAVFSLWILSVTIMKKGEIFNVMRMSMQYIAFAMLVNVLGFDNIKLIRPMLINLCILISVNLYSIFRYPNGMYVSSQNGNWNNWILGYDNHWFIVFFAAMFCALSYYLITNRMVLSLVTIIGIHISAVLVHSGVITFGLAIIDILFVSKLYKSSMLSYRNVWIVAIIANILLMFFSTSGIASFIIDTVFHKTSTSIPARINIWRITLDEIKRSPIVGFGHQSPEYRTFLYQNNHGSNAHNFLLEILYEGGAVGLLLFSMLSLYVGRIIDHLEKEDVIGILKVCILACLVTGSVDSLLESRGSLFFWLLGVGVTMGNRNLNLGREIHFNESSNI